MRNIEIRLLAQQHRHEVGAVGDLARGVIRLQDELNIITGELLEAASENVDSSAWDILSKVEHRKQVEL